jgi:hypothetical protein
VARLRVTLQNLGSVGAVIPVPGSARRPDLRRAHGHRQAHIPGVAGGPVLGERASLRGRMTS